MVNGVAWHATATSPHGPKSTPPRSLVCPPWGTSTLAKNNSGICLSKVLQSHHAALRRRRFLGILKSTRWRIAAPMLRARIRVYRRSSAANWSFPHDPAARRPVPCLRRCGVAMSTRAHRPISMLTRCCGKACHAALRRAKRASRKQNPLSSATPTARRTLARKGITRIARCKTQQFCNENVGPPPGVQNESPSPPWVCVTRHGT
jgi:hypothetical protein